jgi:hypothetical protein
LIYGATKWFKQVPVERTHWHYDIDRILLEFDKVQFDWAVSKNGNRQTCLQYHEEPNNDGAGSFRGMDKVETDYSNINPNLINTIFENIMNDVGAVRTRIMHMMTHTTYSVHRDSRPRYHMALETSSDAFFIFPDEGMIYHIPADGWVYTVDTTQRHTFVNAGPDRTHLVMVKGDYND